MAQYKDIFDNECLEGLFPAQRTDQFFDALFGDAEEGSYDIALSFAGESAEQLEFEFLLKKRPGKCLACSLTYGLPTVFSRHPIINVKGLVEMIASTAGQKTVECWELGATTERSDALHVIPLTVKLC